jgi:phage baseplate assembly protein V
MSPLAALRREIAALRRAIRLLISPAEVTLTDWSTTPPSAQLHLMAGEVVDRVPLMGPFGIAWRPPIGSRGIAAALGGDRSQLVLVGAASSAVAAPSLATGELAIYAQGGASVHLRANGSIHITGPVTVDGPVTATGDVSDMRGSLDLLRTAFNLHVHAETGSITSPAIPQV